MIDLCCYLGSHLSLTFQKGENNELLRDLEAIIEEIAVYPLGQVLQSKILPALPANCR